MMKMAAPLEAFLAHLKTIFRMFCHFLEIKRQSHYTISSTCIFMKNEIKVTRFLEDTSPLRSNLKGEVVKDIDRDKKPQGTKKIIKTSCTRANFY